MIKQNRIANNQKRETERERKTNEIDLLQFSNIKQAVVFQRMSKYAELTKQKKPKEEIEFDVQQDLSAVLEKQYEFSRVKESTKENKNNSSGSFLNEEVNKLERQ